MNDKRLTEADMSEVTSWIVKRFDYGLIPQGKFVLLAVPELDGRSEVHIADFKDLTVLSFKPTGGYVGFHAERGMRLCTAPIMIDGIWTADEDVEASRAYPDVSLEPGLLEMKPI